MSLSIIKEWVILWYISLKITLIPSIDSQNVYQLSLIIIQYFILNKCETVILMALLTTWHNLLFILPFKNKRMNYIMIYKPHNNTYSVNIFLKLLSILTDYTDYMKKKYVSVILLALLTTKHHLLFILAFQK